MIVDGVGDIGGFALRAGVEAADDALQFGEFADHFGGEIAFGEFGGAIGVGDVGFCGVQAGPMLDEPAGDVANALDFVGVAAEAGLVGDLGELGQIVGEPTFLIGCPEKLCVGEAGAENAFVTGGDEALGVFGEIDDGEEIGGEFPVLAFEREVFLVIAHDGDEDLVGEAEELFVEAAFKY